MKNVQSNNENMDLQHAHNNELFCFKGLVAYSTKEMNKTASTLNWIEKINIAVHLLK